LTDTIFSDRYDPRPATPEVTIRRSKIEMHLDVLKTISRGIEKPTRIMFSANSSWLALNNSLSSLESNGLINKNLNDGKVRYSVTEKGFEVLKSYRDFRENLDL